MPIMDVRHSADALDAPVKAELARRLTEVMIRMEGGTDTPGGRDFASVFFSTFAEDDWWIGGRAVSAPGRFLIHVWIPEGYMNVAAKNEVHALVGAAVAAATGRADPPDGLLTIIDEVSEGDWGRAGRPISLSAIAAAVGQPQDGPRMRWSRAYFEAKARAMAAANYPPDTGGLPA